MTEKSCCITPADLKNAVAAVHYWTVPDTHVTVCALTHKDGFVTVGHSLGMTETGTYDPKKGEAIAYNVAMLKLRCHLRG